MKRPFSVQGHRGARGLFPENTLAGFAKAIALGVDAVELDIAITKDGVAVVSHEPRLNPDITRDRLGAWLSERGPPIHSMAVADLRHYDVGHIKPGTAYAATFAQQQPHEGASIPTLAEVLALDRHVHFAIELKTFPDEPGLTASPESMADCVLAVTDRAQVTKRMVLQAFDWRVLRYLRRVRPDVALGWLTKDQPEQERRLWWNGVVAADFGGSVARAVAAEGAQLWIPQFKELDEAAITTAHSLGMNVIPWNVAPELDVSRLVAMRLDGIITDRPDLVLTSDVFGQPPRKLHRRL